ncbi:MAG TPA: efflux RND transporter periplasmic adaptor subunit [Bacteroidota bacterium]|nr:efflux RND transporter periplasmic adaptor subunit [Bacteroidota bacterium]
MKRRLKIVIPVVLILGLISIVVYRFAKGTSSADPRRAQIPLVQVENPLKQLVVYELHFTGDVNAVQQAGVYAKVTGNLEKVYVDMGALVSRGQLLAQIDTTELAQQRQQAAATYENALLLYNRNKGLFEQNLVARQDLDNAEAALKVASAGYDAAKTRLGYAYITAPFAGYITKRFLDPGAVVEQNNATLFTLQDIDKLKVIINILEKDIPRVRMGMKAVVTVDAFPGKQFTGTVVRYSQAVDEATRTMAVEIDIDNHDHFLKPGMFSNVAIAVDEHPDAITVPTMAILKDDQGQYLFTVAGDTAYRVAVQTGLELNGRTEILSSLGASTPVITSGQQFAKDHSPVRIEK